MAKKLATNLRWRTPSTETYVLQDSINDGEYRVERTCCLANAEVLGRCLIFESIKGGTPVQNVMDEESLQRLYDMDATDSPYLCIWCEDFYRERSFCVIVEPGSNKFLLANARGSDTKIITDDEYLFENSECPIMVNVEDMGFLNFVVKEWQDRSGR
jgi:hypothetical protein